jgi:hypothetical protein
MGYDPLFDAAQKAVDDVLGEGEYARLNKDNPGVPKELREKLKRWSDKIDPATIPDEVIASENARRNARKRKSYSGGVVWAKHNPQAKNCRCKRCIARRTKGNAR